jgi:hypothetical protein
MRRAAGAVSPPWLVVVRRDLPDRYGVARSRFDEPLCLVVPDRRRSDRRQRDLPVGADRRHGERRHSLTPGEVEHWLRAGYRLVYQGDTGCARASPLR